MGDLVILHKQLGETVLLEPALRKIALASGQQACLLCPPQWRPLVDLMPHTQFATGKRRWMPERLHSYDSGGRTTRAAAFTFCREKTLLVPDASWVSRTHRAIYSRIDARPPAGPDLARWFWDETPPAIDTAYEPPVLERPPEGWTREGLCPAEPFLLLHPVTTSPAKACESAQWGALLRAAHDLGLKRLLMSGGMESWHYEHCARIAKEARVSVEDVSGMTNLPEFLHLVSRARIVLSVDGAASHLARAFDVPSVTLHPSSMPPAEENPRHARVQSGAADAITVLKTVYETSAAIGALPETPLPVSLREGITGSLRPGR